LFNFNLFPIVLQDGKSNRALPGLIALAPPRKCARGRENDFLFAWINLSGQTSITPENLQDWLMKKASVYYNTAGTVTSAMRTLVEAINSDLLDRNLRKARDGAQVYGAITITVIKKDTGYLLNVGKARAWVIKQSEVIEIGDTDNHPNGLGVNQSLTCRFTQFDISENECFLLMFILTLISVVISGGLFSLQEPLSSNLLQATGQILKTGWPFAVSLLAILGAHEFGHYFAGRAHGVRVTLPFFIPMPFTPLGTMGAVINIKEPPKNRRVLMDIGVAGPIAGYIVSIIVILIGFSLSQVERIPLTFAAGQGIQIEGNSLTYLILKFFSFGQLLPAPASYGSSSPLLYWLGYFFTGKPYPLGGLDVMIHQIHTGLCGDPPDLSMLFPV